MQKKRILCGSSAAGIFEKSTKCVAQRKLCAYSLTGEKKREIKRERNKMVLPLEAKERQRVLVEEYCSGHPMRDSIAVVTYKIRSSCLAKVELIANERRTFEDLEHTAREAVITEEHCSALSLNSLSRELVAMVAEQQTVALELQRQQVEAMRLYEIQQRQHHELTLRAQEEAARVWKGQEEARIAEEKGRLVQQEEEHTLENEQRRLERELDLWKQLDAHRLEVHMAQQEPSSGGPEHAFFF